MPATTIVSWTRRPSPHVCARCSCAATGRAEAWVGPSSTPARTLPATKEFTGFVLGATLPGVPLYQAFGFREIERFTLTMPDGVSIECVSMERAIDRSSAAGEPEASR
jgi:hypothetical protein